MAKVLELQLQIVPSNEYSGLIALRIDGFDLLAVQSVSLLHHSLICKGELCPSLKPELCVMEVGPPEADWAEQALFSGNVASGWAGRPGFPCPKEAAQRNSGDETQEEGRGESLPPRSHPSSPGEAEPSFLPGIP